MLSKKIRELREKKGKTQEELSKVLNKTPSTIGMYEQGRRTPDKDTLIELAKYFNVSTDYLLGIDDLVYGTGVHIRDERKEQSLSTKDLATQADISENMLYQYESNNRPIEFSLFGKIVDCFGMSVPAFNDKYGEYDGAINLEFEGDVDKQIVFEKARDEDVRKENIERYNQTIAAHHDREDWTEEELKEIEQFKQFVKMKRKGNSANKGD